MAGCLCIHHQYKTCGFKHLCLFGMTGEATTGSRPNRMESPSPSLLNTDYSEAGWFGVIFPVCSQT